MNTITQQLSGVVAARGLHVVQVDERDSSWEIHEPRFRVHVHDSTPDATAGATGTFDVTGGDVLQVIDWAQRQVRDDQTYAVALVLDDAGSEALNPGHGRGLVWLVGTDGNDSAPLIQTQEAQRRMLARRSSPVQIPESDRLRD